MSELAHRHGDRVHAHPSGGAHRHLRLPRRSAPVGGPGHGHSHGLVDASIHRSREGLRAVALSLLVLALTAAAQAVVFLAGGSVALLADLIHNAGDAATAIPLSCASPGSRGAPSATAAPTTTRPAVSPGPSTSRRRRPTA
jgi:hypothetical protein